MNNISNLLVQTDRFCDYIPLVSCITNLFDLFQKCVVFPFIDKATIASNHYYKHINEKKLVRCFFLVAINIIGIYVFSKKKHDAVENLPRKEVKTEVRKRTGSLPQDDSLENISKMTKESIDKLCESLVVDDRNDYIKCMLIFAIEAGGRFNGGGIDKAFHHMIPYFQGSDGELKEFVHEDIAAGRANQDTLLHEILKCEFLSSEAKGAAFGFILRDGHDYLRDYFGERILGEMNEWGRRPTYFQVVKWGDSLKNIFDRFSIEQQREFFAFFDTFPGTVYRLNITDRLKSFTGIVEP